MNNLDVQEFRSRCLSAILLKHEIGLADHYAAEFCEELGIPLPKTKPTAAELVGLANAVLLARADAGAAAFKASHKAAKPSKAAEKKAKPAAKVVVVEAPADGMDITTKLQEAVHKAAEVEVPAGHHKISEPVNLGDTKLRGLTQVAVKLDDPSALTLTGSDTSGTTSVTTPPAKTEEKLDKTDVKPEEDDDISKFI